MYSTQASVLTHTRAVISTLCSSSVLYFHPAHICQGTVFSVSYLLHQGQASNFIIFHRLTPFHWECQKKPKRQPLYPRQLLPEATRSRECWGHCGNTNAFSTHPRLLDRTPLHKCCSTTDKQLCARPIQPSYGTLVHSMKSGSFGCTAGPLTYS